MAVALVLVRHFSRPLEFCLPIYDDRYFIARTLFLHGFLRRRQTGFLRTTKRPLPRTDSRVASYSRSVAVTVTRCEKRLCLPTV